MERKLVFQWKGGQREVPLVRAVYTIGRDPACEISIDDESLSRRHAQVMVDGNKVAIKDMGSRNGTWIDAARITETTAMTNLTEVRLGVVQLKLVEEGQGAIAPRNLVRPENLGKIFTVLSQKGGTGKTFVAINLAIALKQESSKRVVMVDMTLPFSGDSMVFLNMPNARAVSDLIRQNYPVAEDTVPLATTEHSSGISVVPVSLHVDAFNKIKPADVAELLDVLRRSYDFVVVDAGTDIGALTLEVLDRSAIILNVLVPELMSVNQGRKTLEFLQHLLYPRETIQLLLNRHTESAKIQPRLIQLNLKKECSAILPEDPAVPQSALAGAPLAASSPKHPITRALRAWAREYMLREVNFANGDRHGLRRDVIEGKEPQVALDTPQPFQKSAEVLELKRRIHTRLIEESNLKQLDLDTMSDQKRQRELRLEVEKKINKLIDEEAASIPSKEQRVILSRDLLNEALGLGPLEYLLADSRVSEIMVNGPDRIYVEQSGKIILTDYGFSSEKHLRRIIERIVQPTGRRIDEKTPMVDTKLTDGSRVNAIIPPLALNGSVLTIRKFSKVPLQVADLVRFNSMTDQMAKFLEACVLVHRNVIISGGTGSGKTTLLNVMSTFIPGDERIVTIEDAAELQLQQDHVVRLETRPKNIEGEGEVSIRDLVKNSLRMRPDRIVVGECRGGEALDMLQAMNTGHDGSLTTVHANTPRDACARLETLCLMAGLDLPSRAIRDQIGSAIHVIVQQSRLADGSRKITHITEITGMEGDKFTMQDIFLFNQTGVDARGKVLGHHEPTGYVPTFLPLVARKGLDVPREIFLRQTA